MENKRLSRRDFLKTAAASAAGAAAFTQMGQLMTVFASPAQQDPTTLTFAVHWEISFQPTQDAFDAQFTEANPDIAIEKIYNTWADHNAIVLTWAAAGQLPDIVYVHGSRTFPWSKEGILLPLDSYIEADPDFNVDGIFPESLRLYKIDGTQFALPYDHGPVLLGYNKTMFDEAGMEYPTEDWTMDDFAEAARALSIPGERWGYGGDVDLGPESAVSHLGPWGGATFNETEDGLLLSTDESRTALNFWNDLMHKDHAITNESERASFTANPALSGQLAMFRMPTWNTPEMHDFATFEWDVAPWPTGPVTRTTGAFGSGFGATATTTHADEVWRYLSAYLSKEGMEFMWAASGRGSPAREDAYPAYLASPLVPENAQYYLDAMKNYAVTGRPYESVTGPQVLDIITQNRTLLGTGEITVDQFIANVEEQAAVVFEQTS
jgi:multiple sugar transport system substrate-binding protein